MNISEQCAKLVQLKTITFALAFVISSTRSDGEKLEDDLGGLRLAGTGLAADHDGLAAP